MKIRKSNIQSGRGRLRRVIVVGAGSAGMMTALRLCEANVPVLLVSRMPARRSLSTASQDGINGTLDLDEGDSPQAHFEDTIVAGDYLAPQPPVRGMTEAAPRLIELLSTMGVPFARTAEGRLSARHLGGARLARCRFVATTTGQHVVAALDQQMRRLETLDATDDRGAAIPGEKMLERLESHDLLSLVLDDDGTVSGIVTADVRTSRVQAFAGDAVCLATGGYGGLFGRTTCGAGSLGTGTAVAFRHGAIVANPELVQFHPTAMAGTSTPVAISTALLSAGARLWLPKAAEDSRPPREVPEREREYVLERLSTVPPAALVTDAGARAISEAVDRGRPRNEPEDGPSWAYLDISHLDPSALTASAGPLLDLFQALTGADPWVEPMRVLPAVHGSLGGVWVDYEARQNGTIATESPRNHATSLPGLYACGEAAYQYHGARRLPGNGLLSALYGGVIAASAIQAYRAAQSRSAFDLPGSVFERQENAARESLEALLERSSNGEGDGDSPFTLRDDLTRLLDESLFASRDDATLDRAVATTETLEERLARARLTDRATHMNQSLELLRHLEVTLPLARAALMAARRRDECRGSHYKPALADRSARGDDGSRPAETTLVNQAKPGDLRFITELEYRCAGSTVRATSAVDTSLMSPVTEEGTKESAS